ncbi:Prolow-density lipoprotein receptor-related protein 1, partial [Stegodyphus mimosarum]
MNCPDNSDEDECVPFNCPKQAFQCDDGTCLSRSLVCNGQWECPDGSDEARCYTGIPCDSSAFRCRNGQCLPQYAFCNAVQDCADGSDEINEICEEGNECPKISHQCSNH